MIQLTKYILESINKRYANMIVISPDNEILILRRSNYMKKFKSLWGFPGGSVENKDKDNKAAAIRELKEETSIELTFNEEAGCKLFDSITNKDNSISEYYIVKLEAKHEVKISNEHSKYEWYHYEKKDDRVYRLMPNIFELIQRYYQE